MASAESSLSHGSLTEDPAYSTVYQQDPRDIQLSRYEAVICKLQDELDVNRVKIAELERSRDHFRRLGKESESKREHFHSILQRNLSDLEAGFSSSPDALLLKKWLTPIWMMDIRESLPWAAKIVPHSSCSLTPVRMAVCYFAMMHVFILLIMTQKVF